MKSHCRCVISGCCCFSGVEQSKVYVLVIEHYSRSPLLGLLVKIHTFEARLTINMEALIANILRVRARS